MQSDERSFSYYLKPIIFGVGISLILSAIMLLVFSFVLVNVDIPLSAISPIMIVIMGISVFLGSFIVARSVRRRGLFLGLCISLLFFIIMLLVSAATSPMGIGLDALWRFLVSLIAGVLGGVFGVNSKMKALF